MQNERIPKNDTVVDRNGSSFRNQMVYGPGGFSENLVMNSVAQLVNPVFAIALGVSPALVGIAMAIPRFLDAFTDPLMGSISDNWKSRWGRRRPFIFLGAIITGLCIATFWWTPENASSQFHFIWLLSFLLLTTVGTTMFGVPYVAMGMEVPKTDVEVTSWMGWRSIYAKSSGVLVQWLFFFVQLSFFSGILVGARVVGFVAGVLIAVMGCIPALFIREDPTVYKSVERVPFWKSWGLTIRNHNFLILASVAMLVFMSILLVDTLGFYLQVYYVFEGDLAGSSVYKGLGGTVFHVVGITSVPVITQLAKRYGKRRAFNFCILSIIFGGAIRLFCYFPGSSWLTIVPNFFLAPGLVAVLVLIPSMLADVAAEEARETGHARQGMFAATMNWVIKLSNSGVAFASGLILLTSGWVNELGSAQDPTTFLTMRWTYALGTVFLAIFAAAILRYYRPQRASDGAT